MPKKITLKHCQEYAKTKNGKCLSEEYINMKTKMTWQCSCGYIWDAVFNNIKNGNCWCPKCGGSLKNNLHDCQKVAKTKGGTCLIDEYTNAHTKLKWQCKDGHIWFATPDNVKNGDKWCPYCSGCIKYTLKDCQEFAKNKSGRCLSDTYNNNLKPLLWECSKKHTWKASFMSVNRQNSWCPYCAKKAKLTIDEIKDAAKLRGGVCLSDKYINSKTKLIFKCANNHIWKVAPCSIYNNKTWCPYCSNRAKSTIEDCQKIAQNHGGKCLSKKYINNSTNLKWQCKNGHTWLNTLANTKCRKTWCRVCSGNISITIDECKKIAQKNDGKCLSNKYVSGKKLKWQCKYGHVWEVEIDHVKYTGTWCPACKVWKNQNKIFNIVSDIYEGLTVEANTYPFDWLRNKQKLEIDIWVPDVKLAIEYDGQQHFEPVRFGKSTSYLKAKSIFKQTQYRDQLKNKLISEHPEEIHTFIRIPYTELLEPGNIRDIINKNLNNNIERNNNAKL